MDVLLTGATGFVGKALVLRLLGAGHRVAALVRSKEKARATLGPDVELVARDDLAPAVDRSEGIINLAGEPVLPRRWTQPRKRALVTSRVGTTQALVEAMRIATSKRRVLLSASAVGYYGDRGEVPVDESSPPGSGFLAGLCFDWEAAARAAELVEGVRVATFRIGVVLGPEGGALAPMLPLFRLGLGGRYGSGRQRVSWIHQRDLVEILVTALGDGRWTGPINAVAPHPATGTAFAREIGRTLGRPSWLPVPSRVLGLMLGEAAQVLSTGQKVLPRRLTELGYEFRFPTLESALADALEGDLPHVGLAPAPPQDSRYLAESPARYLLEQLTEIDAPLSEVWDFFCKPENLGLLTPPAMAMRIRGSVPPVTAAATSVDYDLRVAGVPVRWRSVIERWEPEEAFVDVQERGPYRSWWHEHRFREQDGRTVMEDRVWYTPPLALLSQPMVVKPALQRIFAFRSFAIRLRFTGRLGGEVRRRPPGVDEQPSVES
ncbi:MAG: TIGR01777 family protein [Deltaproteobacteria bacterium]|nr:TIGR01777 family protein [Deltaproteobacteria bacterium]